jgi:hypothetical protein
MRSYGLSEEKAMEVMWEHWAKLGPTPWNPGGRYERLEAPVSHAYEYATSQPGNMTDAYRKVYWDTSKLFSPVAKADTPEQQYAALVKHFEGVLRGKGDRQPHGKMFGDLGSLPAVEWIIRNWLTKDGVWFLYGESGAYKTYMAINMLLCVTSGRPWGRYDGCKGYHVGDPRQAIAFFGESSTGCVERTNTAIEGGKFDRKAVEQNLAVVDDVYAINRADGLAGMAFEINRLNLRPAMIVVDTMNLALDGNEDSSEEIKKAVKAYGAVALVIDHVGHSKDAKDRQRGSSAKKAKADGTILCERDGKRVWLSQGKNREADKDKFVAMFESAEVPLGADADPYMLDVVYIVRVDVRSGLTVTEVRTGETTMEHFLTCCGYKPA